MNHPMRYHGNDPGAYEAALLDLFRKYPPSLSEFSITLHETGKISGRGKLTQPWPASVKTVPEKAKRMAETIVAECKRLSGRAIKGITLDF